MAEQSKYDNDRYWSGETCSLKKIPEMKLPVLVKVSEGIYSEDDCDTFSRGDIIKIDSCQQIERVEGFVAKWDNNRYQQTPTEIKIPLHYNGWVNVLPMQGVAFQFTSVKQLMHYFPKKVRTGFGITFDDMSGEDCSLAKDEVLEILTVIGNQDCEDAGLLVRTTTSDIILPGNVKGSFITVSHDRNYAISDVMKFPMPQCIRFVEQDFSTTVTKTFPEAAAKMRRFQHDVILTGKVQTTTILCGHYKALDHDPSSSVYRRSAVILPLDNEDVANIEVQFPIDMDDHDYGDFVIHHFSKQNATQPIEGLLYVEFEKVSRVHFIEDVETPPRPPRPLPPLPRHSSECSAPKTEMERQVLTHREGRSATLPGKIQDGHVPSPPVRTYKDADYHIPVCQTKYTDSLKDLSSGTMLIGESFTQRTSVTDNVQLRNPLNKLIKKVKIPNLSRLLINPTTKRIPSQFSTDSVNKTSSDERDEHVYDYIDQDYRLSDTPSKNFLKKKYDKLLERFTGNRGDEKVAPGLNQAVRKDISKMSVRELGECFLRCGLPKLEAVCNRHTIDGELFLSFSRNNLKEKPFLLKEFDIIKVEKILRGWRPKE